MEKYMKNAAADLKEVRQGLERCLEMMHEPRDVDVNVLKSEGITIRKLNIKLPDSRYICKECNAEANVDADGTITRTCEHNTTVILDISVEVTGESNLS